MLKIDHENIKLDVTFVSNPKAIASTRLVSLDAYRGFIMLIMCISHGFGLSILAKKSGIAAGIAATFTHVPWEGWHFLDLVQPAFMFMVGVAMPFAFARRQELGATFAQNFRHVIIRAFILIIISQIIISIANNNLQFQLINVLSQIAITYFLCFWIMQIKFRWQILVAILILGLHWGSFILFHGSSGSFSQTDNIGAIIDRAILGRNYPGFYVTINFISSTVTTLFGVWTGTLLMKNKSHVYKIILLSVAAVLCLIVGLILTPLNPMIKRLWTESFTFFSAGCVILMLLVFYWLEEMRGYRRLIFPFVVVGMNSIFIYCVAMMLFLWIDSAIAIFTGRFEIIGSFGPIVQTLSVLLVLWYLCYWLYQRKIFFKV